MTVSVVTSGPRKIVKPIAGPHPTRHVYDVIILGSQLAGSLTGALLAKRGYRVLQLDTEGLGASYEYRDYQLPYAPAVFPLLRRLPAAETALSELGIAVDLNRVLEISGGEAQLLFPNHRLDLPLDNDRRGAEIDREFAGQKDQIFQAITAANARAEATDQFFRTSSSFPPTGFLEKWTSKRQMQACPALQNQEDELRPINDLPFGQAMHGLGRFLTYLEDEEISGLGRTRTLAQVLKGAYRFPGGQIGLREAVRKRFTEIGGDLLGSDTEPIVVEELLFEHGHFSGVKLASSLNVFRAQSLVANMDVSSLATLIPPKVKKHGMSDLFSSVRTRRTLFSINLVVQQAGLPVGLKDLAIIITDQDSHSPILLEVQNARRAGHDIAEERVLCAGAFVNRSEQDSTEEKQRSIAQSIERSVLAFAPFIEPYIIAQSVPSLDASNLKGIHPPFHPLLEIDADGFLGIAGLQSRTPCKNLFLASREIMPGLGLEGEFLTGCRTAALVQETLKKHDPLK